MTRKLKDLSNMRITSVTDQYDAARRKAREVVQEHIDMLERKLSYGSVDNRPAVLSEIDLLEAWLNGEERMVAERTIYDA
jgi:hypothetical protein